jgi:hypothetical protein
VATTTLLHPHPSRYPSSAVRYLCQTWWTCSSTPRHTWRRRCDTLLATDQLLSVIPRAIQHDLELVVAPVRGWKGQVPAWFGVPCRIGRVTVWLPVEDDSSPHRDLSLLALLPTQDLEDAPPFIHLGTQFLLEHQVQVVIDCSSPGATGRLIIPSSP